MANYLILMAVIASFLQIINARNLDSTKIKFKDPVKNSSAYVTYEELYYILQSRRGEGAKTPPKRFTPCARAILGCCENNVMNEYCSVSLKCGAFFFDDNPCEDKFIISALDAAKAFYEQFQTITELQE